MVIFCNNLITIIFFPCNYKQGYSGQMFIFIHKYYILKIHIILISNYSWANKQFQLQRKPFKFTKLSSLKRIKTTICNYLKFLIILQVS